MVNFDGSIGLCDAAETMWTGEKMDANGASVSVKVWTRRQFVPIILAQ